MSSSVPRCAPGGKTLRRLGEEACTAAVRQIVAIHARNRSFALIDIRTLKGKVHIEDRFEWSAMRTLHFTARAGSPCHSWGCFWKHGQASTLGHDTPTYVYVT